MRIVFFYLNSRIQHTCYSHMKNKVLWFVTPCNWKNIRLLGGTYRHFQGWRVGEASRVLFVTWSMLVSCLPYFWILKMEATCFSESSVDFHPTTRRYIPGDRTLHNHRCENLKPYIFVFTFPIGPSMFCSPPPPVDLCNHLPCNLLM
jgi:hypothetical protein